MLSLDYDDDSADYAADVAMPMSQPMPLAAS